MPSSASTNRVFNANQVLARIYKSTLNYIGVRELTADSIPSSNLYDTTELAYWTIDRGQTYISHPFRTTYLSTGFDSTERQFLTAVAASTKASSKTSNAKAVVASSINWPGLDGSFIDEVEFDLRGAVRAATATKTTIGYYWQWKNATATTLDASWKNLSTIRLITSTDYTTHRFMGRAKTGTGYNKIPLAVKLSFYHKTASKGAGKVDVNSHIAIRAKKTS